MENTKKKFYKNSKHEFKQKKDPVRQEFNAADGKTTAANAVQALNSLQINVGEDWKTVIAHPFSVSHFEIDVPEMVRAWEDRFKGAIRKAINICAVQYYVTDNIPTDDIYDALVDVIEDSAEAYSFIIALFRAQNRTQIRDNLGNRLAGLFDPEDSSNRLPIAPNAQITDLAGDWPISNAVWAKDYIECLDHFYLSPKMRNVLDFLFSQVFKLQRDDATMRYAQCTPKRFEPESGEYPEDPLRNEDNFMQYINDQVATIDATLAQYNCLTDILAYLGLTTGHEIDLVRDLTGTTLTAYDDRDGHVEAMLYAVSSGDWDYDNAQPTTSMHAIFSVPTNVSYYENGELRVPARMQLDAITVTNLLRKATARGMLTYAQKSYNTETDTPAYNLFAAYHGQTAFSDLTDFSKDEVHNACVNNYMNAILDSVGSATTDYCLGKSAGGDLESAKGLRSGLNDYVMNAGDVDNVIAETSFSVLFGESQYIKENTNVYVNTQRMEANGK